MSHARGGPGARPLQTRDHTVVTLIHYAGRFALEAKRSAVEDTPPALRSDLAAIFEAWRQQAPDDTLRHWTPRLPLPTLASVPDERRRRGGLPFDQNAPDGRAADDYRAWDADGDVEFQTWVSYMHDAYTLAFVLNTDRGDATRLIDAYGAASQRLQFAAQVSNGASGDVLGSTRVHWAEYDASDAPDVHAASATACALLRPWREHGVLDDRVIREADVQVLETAFGFCCAFVVTHEQPEYVFLVRRSEHEDDGLAEANAALIDVMPALTLAEAKVRYARAHLDALARRSADVRSAATTVLDDTNSDARRATSRFGYASHSAEQRAIAKVAERIPELSALRDDLAAEREVIAINRANLAHQAWRLDAVVTGTPFEQAVLRFADLAARQADADIARVERVLDRVTLELEAVRVSAGVRTLRLDQNLTIVVATFVLLGIPQAFPELYRLGEDWTWLAAAAPIVRAVLLPLSAIASVFVIILVLDIVIARARERFSADRTRRPPT